MEEDELKAKGSCELGAEPLELSPRYPRSLAGKHRVQHDKERIAFRKRVIGEGEKPSVHLP